MDDIQRLNFLREVLDDAFCFGDSLVVFLAVSDVVKIFNKRENREVTEKAEKILREALNYDDRPTQFFICYVLWKNKERGIDWQTEIELEKFLNNPANEEVRIKMERTLKKEKAHLN